MYANCHIEQISYKAVKIPKSNRWDEHISVTQLPMYMIYRTDELPCKKTCNKCDDNFDIWLDKHDW